ncbi:helix-turn-helix domain-containing protein [Streptomyces sp. NBC_01142]|uniref:helix-turn-helix domain-containing protein n=1 Tax=Streptomyces sp. NBC_01142 TaxID=2975865 RepID=UPI0022533EAD|nr:helix-turn-helix domain-containing protein [Streptomyces sp. NBC_01142]MCX4824402.1 helix-turn-helix domain-containing protein [Streptomyces sp. NBC_01142]
MTGHSRHSVTAVTLPHLFRPAEIAEALGCSEWWVKEQARQRRIPFTRAGGAYRFTAEHCAEIIALFEERPDRSAGVPQTAPARRTRKQRTAEPTTRLVARPPRRVLRAQQLAAA